MYSNNFLWIIFFSYVILRQCTILFSVHFDFSIIIAHFIFSYSTFWLIYIQSLISILLLILIHFIDEIAQFFFRSASELFSLQNLSRRHDKAANARDQHCDFLQTNSFGNEKKAAEKLCVSSLVSRQHVDE